MVWTSNAALGFASDARAAEVRVSTNHNEWHIHGLWTRENYDVDIVTAAPVYTDRKFRRLVAFYFNLCADSFVATREQDRSIVSRRKLDKNTAK